MVSELIKIFKILNIGMNIWHNKWDAGWCSNTCIERYVKQKIMSNIMLWIPDFPDAYACFMRFLRFSCLQLTVQCFECDLCL